MSSYRKWFLCGAAILSLAVSFVFQRSLNQQRMDPALGLMRVTDLGSNAPPVLAFTTVALGGFRGLIANALWIRANELQTQGKYFEMVQLADWITKLQPTFVQVWLVQAWNMAYNISVKFTEPADRWRWVQRGIELLRDYGIRYNPRETLIYRELGWFFQHKMGQNLDDAHMYYKTAWAFEMQDLFGAPQPNLESLINPQTPDAQLRAARLRDRYKMDPILMKEIDEKYGPLDWRLPETHAIYWAMDGLRKCKDVELITLRRLIYQSMHIATLRGRILVIQRDQRIRLGPNLRIAEKTHATYLQMIRDEKEKPHAVQIAHKNFLKELVYLTFANGRTEEATRWFNYLQKEYPEMIPAGVSMEQYAMSRINEVLNELNSNRTSIIVHGFLETALIAAASDEDDRALNLELMAKRIYDNYREKARGSEERIGMPPYAKIRELIISDLLNEQYGLPPEMAARLRTKENIPATTNAPNPQAVAPSGNPM